MSQIGANNKRIAKNTLMLYFRMFFIMGITLYTSRVVLKTLGVEDFGIYNVVGGVIVLFGFLNNAMSTAVMRYLNIAIGKANLSSAQEVYSASVKIHALISLLVLLLGESIGLWFLTEYISIPPGREEAAFWVFHFTILGTCANILRTPYLASVMATEQMGVFAVLSIIENILRLGIVFLLLVFNTDALITYSVLTFAVISVTTLSYVLYCRKKLNICRTTQIRTKDIYKQLLSFSGWSLFGSLADIGGLQGLNVIFNIFLGVVVNAAMGLSTQVMTAVYTFSTSFQTAFKPQIIKLYAAGEQKHLTNLIFKTSRLSFFLLLIIVVPFLLGTETILSLWLHDVPPHTVAFTRLLLIYVLIDGLSAPLWITAQAIGNIRNYQIIISICILLIIPVSLILLKCGTSPEVVLGAKVLLNLLCHLVRMKYLQDRITFPIKEYFMETMLPVLSVCLIIAPCCVFVFRYCTLGDEQLFIDSFKMLFAFFFTCLTIYTIGLKKTERTMCVTYITKILQKTHLCKPSS